MLLPDWSLYRSIYLDEEISSVYCEEMAIAYYLDFEKAVAIGQAEHGIIPQWAAEAIDALELTQDDLEATAEGTTSVGRPVLPFIRALSARLQPEVVPWLHYGITSQDVIDTSTNQLIRDAIAVIFRRLRDVASLLGQHSREHAATLMIARTNGGYAQPISFGFKTATWLDTFTRHYQRLTQAEDRVAIVQFGGPVGTLASQYPHGRSIRQLIASRLNLRAPVVATQAARDSVAELVLVLGLIGATVERIGREIALLASTDLDEIVSDAEDGRSSSMPHKRNLRAAEFTEALGGLSHTRASAAFSFVGTRFEREGGTWLREWPTVPEVFQYTSSGLRHLSHLLDDIRVNESRMTKNLQAGGFVAMASDAMRALAPLLGTRAADKAVQVAARKAAHGGDFAAELTADPEVKQVIDSRAMLRIMDPARHVPALQAEVDAILAHASEAGVLVSGR